MANPNLWEEVHCANQGGSLSICGNLLDYCGYVIRAIMLVMRSIVFRNQQSSSYGNDLTKL